MRSMLRFAFPAVLAALGLVLAACPGGDGTPHEEPAAEPAESGEAGLVNKYTTVRLTTDTSVLSDAQKQMIPLLIEAAQAMDGVFWRQAYGDRDALLASIDDPDLRRFAEINYGPWDRLDGNEPFVEGVGPKPPGAQFYPEGATEEEIEEAAEGDPSILGLYTLVERDAEGGLVSVPYSQAYGDAFTVAADKLRRPPPWRRTRASAGISSCAPTLSSQATTWPATWRGWT